MYSLEFQISSFMHLFQIISFMHLFQIISFIFSQTTSFVYSLEFQMISFMHLFLLLLVGASQQPLTPLSMVAAASPYDGILGPPKMNDKNKDI